MNFVKTISSIIDSADKLKVKFLRMGRSDVRESKQITPFGIDSNPVKDAIAVYSETGVLGDDIILGYIVKRAGAQPGETKIFSTNDNAVEQIFIHLKKNGDIWFGGNAGNLTRFQELQTAFDQLKADHNDLASKWNSFAAAYVPGSPTTVGLPPTLSGQNVPPSTADMSGAKIDKFKTL